MTKGLLSLFEGDAALRETFEVVAEEKKARFQDLLESLGVGREEALDRLYRLEEAGLIKSKEAPGAIEDLRWYYLTGKGWTARRRVRRLRRRELVP
jgi:Mn-dependent DtxR family transcriptional regulator